MTIEAEVTVEPQADVATETTVETTENQEATTEAAEATPELTLEEKYRKAENKIRHDREKIAKARAREARVKDELAAANAELAKVKTEREQKATASQKPKMEDFDSVEAYVEAMALAVHKENNQQAPKEAVLTPQQQQEQFAVQARLKPVAMDTDGTPMSAIDVEAAEFAKLVPDASEVFEDAVDTLRDLPAHTQRLLILAQNGPQAVYNLHKEGRLEYLGYLPPEIAALEIQRAGSAGGTRTAVSKAPAPISPARGAAVGEKALAAKSGKELLKWVKSSN